ncbi:MULTISPECIES: hypothetical protein [Desulfitobacterium]|uniref:Uncharacterized protein n=1 Tax=Desulfitobacterium dehalogenans (strain ATCC 51507 / DSM 9161 / JW/IU-DC1) TaxID=756499 RepID=I4ADV5_DESDJ|nr:MULTISPECIES: hypothetical protein [Desulfitobacterium]AFM02140.1 hypothetical protein Desde_3873 [Desulfitobacterium dehalogenans ATCC 51507]
MEFDKKKVLTLAGTLVLAGAVVVGGIYGPSAWKVFMNKAAPEKDSVVIQTPPVEGANPQDPNVTESPPGQSSGVSPAVTVTEPPGINATPQGDVSGPKKYKEPDTKDISLAPSVAGFFGENGLSQDAQNLVFGAAWNVHQYVDGYLFGPNAGPQMNEEDIKRYIVFHKSLWDQRLKSETNPMAQFSEYFSALLNRGADAFNAKDKVRIEQFHQELHDLDTHLMRDDQSSKIYGATPFATKR